MLKRQRGDTMVEVMVAFAIFAMAAVGAIAIMNRGIAMTQRSLEITLVREQIDSQADMLRYVRDSDLPIWDDVRSVAGGASTAATDPQTVCPESGDALPAGSFFIHPAPASLERVTLRGGGDAFSPAQTYARLDTDERRSYGLWVQPVRVDATTYDMYINACWDTVGSEMPLTLRTIVRLYES